MDVDHPTPSNLSEVLQIPHGMHWLPKLNDTTSFMTYAAYEQSKRPPYGYTALAASCSAFSRQSSLVTSL